MAESRTSIRFLLAGLGLVLLCGFALNLNKRPPTANIAGHQPKAAVEQQRLPRSTQRPERSLPPIDTRYRPAAPGRLSYRPPTPEPAPAQKREKTPAPTIVNKIDTSGLEKSLTDIRSDLAHVIERQNQAERDADRQRIARLENEIDRLRSINKPRDREPMTVQVELKGSMPAGTQVVQAAPATPTPTVPEEPTFEALLPQPAEQKVAQRTFEERLSDLRARGYRPFVDGHGDKKDATTQNAAPPKPAPVVATARTKPATKRLLPSGHLVDRQAGATPHFPPSTASSAPSSADSPRNATLRRDGVVFMLAGRSPLRSANRTQESDSPSNEKKKPTRPYEEDEFEIAPEPKEEFKAADNDDSDDEPNDDDTAREKKSATKDKQTSRSSDGDDQRKSNFEAKVNPNRNRNQQRAITIYQPVLVPYSPLTNQIQMPRAPAPTGPSYTNPPISLNDLYGSGSGRTMSVPSAPIRTGSNRTAGRVSRASLPQRAYPASTLRTAAHQRLVHGKNQLKPQQCRKCGRIQPVRGVQQP